MRNTGLDEAQAEIRIARRHINNLRYADDTTLMAESEEELKMMKVKEESEKVGLKLNIQKNKIMASCPITSWQIDGETVRDFSFLGSKITAGCDWSHKIKRHLFLGRKAVTNLDSRDITLPTVIRVVKGMVFSSSHVMWELDHKGWTTKIDALELWCWKRLLRVPWTARGFKPVSPKGH